MSDIVVTEREINATEHAPELHGDNVPESPSKVPELHGDFASESPALVPELHGDQISESPAKSLGTAVSGGSWFPLGD